MLIYLSVGLGLMMASSNDCVRTVNDCFNDYDNENENESNPFANYWLGLELGLGLELELEFVFKVLSPTRITRYQSLTLTLTRTLG
jgi:hypothetical protein